MHAYPSHTLYTCIRKLIPGGAYSSNIRTDERYQRNSINLFFKASFNYHTYEGLSVVFYVLY